VRQNAFAAAGLDYSDPKTPCSWYGESTLPSQKTLPHYRPWFLRFRASVTGPKS